MAVTLTGSGGLFSILGKLLKTIEDSHVSQGSTIPDDVAAVLVAFNDLTESPELEAVLDGLSDATLRYKTQTSLAQQVQTVCRELIIKLVDDDDPLPAKTIEAALAELIEQMVAESESVDAAGTVSATVTAGSGNQTDAVLYASAKLANGRTAERAFAETLRFTRQSATQLSFEGEAAAANTLSPDWPLGSGVRGSLSFAKTNRLTNGSFDTENTTAADRPDGWDVQAGTIGSTISLSNVEVQTVAISGTPTGGSYTLTYTDADSNTQTTAPLAYNATASAVQSALRLLTGLDEVTVTATGTSPDYTHTITFTGLGGNVAQLTSTNSLTGGTSPTITHNTTTGGEVAFSGRSLLLDGGAENPSLRQAVTLQPLTCYSWGVWLKEDVQPAAGVLTIELVDGSGTVITDAESTNNAATVDLTSGGPLSTSAWVHQGGFFRTPASLPAVVYFRFRLSTAMSSGSILAIDEMRLIEADQAYAGGPFLAGFQGLTAIAPGDVWEVDIANAREGEFQEWFFRLFGNIDLLLPSDNTGNETVADSLI